MSFNRDAREPAPPLSDEVLACAHAARCGGCTRIGEPYSVQRAAKGARLARGIARYASLAAVPVGPVQAAPSTRAYRTRAKLVAAPGPLLGLYARGEDHAVEDTQGCPVLAPAVLAATECVRALMREGSIAALKPFREGEREGERAGERSGALRAIDVREVRPPGETPGTLVTLVLDHRARVTDGALLFVARTLQQRERSIVGVAVAWHDGVSPRVLGGTPRVVLGDPCVRDTTAGSPVFHLATHGSFVQAHRGSAELLHALVADWVLGQEPSRACVLELYAGSGALGLALARAGASVTLVEAFGPAIELADEAAYAQRLASRVRAYEGDAARTAHAMAEARERFDAVVVNPPRRGLDPSVRESLAALGPRRVAYVSCEPETLARDLDHLARLGFECVRLAPFDMFPQTDEVETVALLVARNEPSHAPHGRRTHAVEGAPPLLLVEACAHDEVPAHDGLPRWLSAVRATHPVGARGLFTGASGLCVAACDARSVAPEGPGVWVALARGVLRAKGRIQRPAAGSRGATSRYERVRVVSGHSLVRVECDPDDGEVLARHLASIGHPVLGDTRFGDPGSNRYFAEKHGLDRAFLHRSRVHGIEREAPLADDLAAVLGRLESADATQPKGSRGAR